MDLNKKGQGAIEYLLLLAASIVVVAIVISFLSGTISPVKNQGNRQLYESICNGPLSLDNNNLLCGCYLKDPTLGEKNNQGIFVYAGAESCPELLPENYKDDPLLDWIPEITPPEVT